VASHSVWCVTLVLGGVCDKDPIQVKISGDHLNLWFWILVFLPFFIMDAVCTVLLVLLILYISRVKLKGQARRKSLNNHAAIDRANLGSNSACIRKLVDTFVLLRAQIKKQGKMMRLVISEHDQPTDVISHADSYFSSVMLSCIVRASACIRTRCTFAHTTTV
jgi:hypothetical protein